MGARGLEKGLNVLHHRKLKRMAGVLLACLMLLPVSACDASPEEVGKAQNGASKAASYIFGTAIKPSDVSISHYSIYPYTTMTVNIKLPQTVYHLRSFDKNIKNGVLQLPKVSPALDYEGYALTILDDIGYSSQLSRLYDVSPTYVSQIITADNTLIDKVSLSVSAITPAGAKQVFDHIENLDFKATNKERTDWINKQSTTDFDYILTVGLVDAKKPDEFLAHAGDYLHFNALPQDFKFSLTSCKYAVAKKGEGNDCSSDAYTVHSGQFTPFQKDSNKFYHHRP